MRRADLLPATENALGFLELRRRAESTRSVRFSPLPLAMTGRLREMF